MPLGDEVKMEGKLLGGKAGGIEWRRPLPMRLFG